MICINCFHDKTSVSNSRAHKKHSSVWRRRTCARCHNTFTTVETPSENTVRVYYPDTGQHKPFSLCKLTLSIAKSFAHNAQVAEFESMTLANTVLEKAIRDHGQQLSADDIAAITHTTLHAFDPTAALQYAAQHNLIANTRRTGRPATSYVSRQHSDEKREA